MIEIHTAVELVSSALAGWALKTSNRQGRIEQELTDFRADTEVRMRRLEVGIGKIGKHITGADLW